MSSCSNNSIYICRLWYLERKYFHYVARNISIFCEIVLEYILSVNRYIYIYLVIALKQCDKFIQAWRWYIAIILQESVVYNQESQTPFTTARTSYNVLGNGKGFGNLIFFVCNTFIQTGRVQLSSQLYLLAS